MEGRIEGVGMEVREVILREFYERRRHRLGIPGHVNGEPVGLPFMPPREIAQKRCKRKRDDTAEEAEDEEIGKDRALMDGEEAAGNS